MTEKSANQNNTEKCGNNNEQFKTSTQCKIFNRRGFIRNKKKNNCRYRNNRNNFNKRFQNNFDRRNHFKNEKESFLLQNPSH